MAKALILYGAPGSGKGTQAGLLERNHEFIHFDPGRHIESLVHSPEAKKDPVLAKERKNFDAGRLCTPSWVLKIANEAITGIIKSGFNMVTSGSPRTLYEAFGENDKGGLFKKMERLVGKENILVIVLDVEDKHSVERNSARRLCSFCGLPVLKGAKLNNCSFCAAPFYTRTLDKPEVIKKRLVEYQERTFPILAQAKKEGYKVIKIDGTLPPYKVGEKIEKILGYRK
jgi:adenylate kinase